MKKAFSFGIIGSFFFAFTFLLNRSMNLAGGHWIWSASLRYFFSLPILAVIIAKQSNFPKIHAVIRQNTAKWILWSTVGFGLFYAPLCYASDHGESWLIAASWQITIVAGLFMAPIFGQRIPLKNFSAACIILVGVLLLQAQHVAGTNAKAMLPVLLPLLIAAISYPLGNRKMMSINCDQLTTTERTYAMTLCSMPFWGALSIYGLFVAAPPSAPQLMQSFFVALFSGVIATLLFFRATDLVKTNQKQLAFIESTQSGEVLFTLLGGIILLGDAAPNGVGLIGILLILAGMILNSFLSA